jgi:hypothetical protein
VSTTATAVYAALASFANGDGECWPSQDRIAEVVGVHPGTVRRALAELRAAGHVGIRPRLVGNAKRGNVYTLQTPDRALTRERGAEEPPAETQNGVNSRSRVREQENSSSRTSARSVRAPARVRPARERSIEEEKTNEEQTNERDVLLAPVIALNAPVLAVDAPSLVEQIFGAWVVATGRTGRTQLTAKRERLIRARLKEGYEVGDLLDAVRGWRHSRFHCGENDSGTVFNDLGLLLRDGEHVEKFRELERAGPQPAPAYAPELAQIARLRQMTGRS